jgi:hypothetical protein
MTKNFLPLITLAEQHLAKFLYLILGYGFGYSGKKSSMYELFPCII